MPTVTADVVADLADRLFAAIERGDVAAVGDMWSDDVAVWKSAEPEDQAKERAMRVIVWFIDTNAERRYEILDQQFFDGGFVQQHILHATGRNGGLIGMRVCIVIKVGADGLIERIDEYFDPREVEPLL